MFHIFHNTTPRPDHIVAGRVGYYLANDEKPDYIEGEHVVITKRFATEQEAQAALVAAEAFQADREGSRPAHISPLHWTLSRAIDDAVRAVRPAPEPAPTSGVSRFNGPWVKPQA